MGEALARESFYKLMRDIWIRATPVSFSERFSYHPQERLHVRHFGRLSFSMLSQPEAAR